MKIKLFTIPNILTLCNLLSGCAAAVFALMMVLTNIKPLKKLHPLYFIAFAAVLGIVFEL